MNTLAADQDRLREAALRRLEQEEAIAEEQERQAEEQRKQVVRRQMDAQEEANRDRARVALHALTPLYVRRRALVAQLTDPAYVGEVEPAALTQLFAVETELRVALSQIDFSSIRDYLRPFRDRGAMQRLREEAGLAPDHVTVGIVKPAQGPAELGARSVVRMITAGQVQTDRNLNDNF